MVTLIIALTVILALSKGVADIVSDEPNWSKSIFSRFDISSFWGCKDYTWHRKYRHNKILNYVFSTILVWTSDIWHFANMIGRLSMYSIMCLIPTCDDPIFMVASIAVINTVGFHLFYHYILRR